jgi:capsular exopolysaccharide synthesis family protein
MTRYNGLLDKETVLQETAASQATVINLVSSGSIPTAPSSPHPFVNALVAFFLVFLLTLGGGMLTQALADEVGGEEELKELTGLPILGSIPFIPSLRKQPESPAALVMANQPRSAAAEAFRVARTSLTLSDIDRPAGTILVSSSVAEEGKTVVSANLALAFAESGVSTILVDLDLRHPSLDRIFESPNGGLTTLLMDSSRKPEDFLVGTSNPNLRVLNTGPLPPTPTELLTSERLRLTMESLRESVDLLILDSPPLLAVADARIAAGYCDAVVLVIRPDIIRRRIVTHSVESVLSTGVRVAGIVINSASPEQGGYFLSSYAYRYTHGFTRRQYGGENPGQKKALADQKG